MSIDLNKLTKVPNKTVRKGGGARTANYDVRRKPLSKNAEEGDPRKSFNFSAAAFQMLRLDQTNGIRVFEYEGKPVISVQHEDDSDTKRSRGDKDKTQSFTHARLATMLDKLNWTGEDFALTPVGEKEGVYFFSLTPVEGEFSSVIEEIELVPASGNASEDEGEDEDGDEGDEDGDEEQQEEVGNESTEEKENDDFF